MTTVETKEEKRAAKRLAAKIEIGKEMAKEQDRTFVPAIIKEIDRKEMVLVRLPKISAKFLEKVEDHGLLVLEGDALNGIRGIDVPGHYVHKDFTERLSDGSLRPSVFRHLYVHAEFLGETIPAEVTIQKKTCLATGEVSILINVNQILTKGDTIEVNHELRLGVTKTGVATEIEIPGSPDRYIRIDELEKPKKIVDRITVVDKTPETITGDALLTECREKTEALKN